MVVVDIRDVDDVAVDVSDVDIVAVVSRQLKLKKKNRSSFTIAKAAELLIGMRDREAKSD